MLLQDLHVSLGITTTAKPGYDPSLHLGQKLNNAPGTQLLLVLCSGLSGIS